MNRIVKAAALLITAAGILGQPAVAFADSTGAAVIIGDDNQVAGDDIFNAGHDNIVGSGNGAAALGAACPPRRRATPPPTR